MVKQPLLLLGAAGLFVDSPPSLLSMVTAMAKTDRDYDRLLHLRNGDKYNRDNREFILRQSVESNDVFQKDFYIVSSNSTDDYSEKLTSERWKDATKVSRYEDDLDFISDDNSMKSKILIFQFETAIATVDASGDKNLLITMIFMSLIHNKFQLFSQEFQDNYFELRTELIYDIQNFQSKKSGKTRVSKITTSFQKFLIKKLELPESEVKKLIRKYKNITTRIFK